MIGKCVLQAKLHVCGLIKLVVWSACCLHSSKLVHLDLPVAAIPVQG